MIFEKTGKTKFMWKRSLCIPITVLTFVRAEWDVSKIIYNQIGPKYLETIIDCFLHPFVFPYIFYMGSRPTEPACSIVFACTQEGLTVSLS